jgi:hypothetical protein
MLSFRVLCLSGIIILVLTGSCAQMRSVSSRFSQVSSLSSPLLQSNSPIEPPVTPTVFSSPYPIDTNLEAIALKPADLPFIHPLYVLRTEIREPAMRGIELRYPAEEDRYHPFIKGFAVELRLFQDIHLAWETYERRLSPLERPYRTLQTMADEARWRLYTSEGPHGETIWIHEVAFWKGNLVGYLLIKWSEPLTEEFLQERVNLILQRMGR